MKRNRRQVFGVLLALFLGVLCGLDVMGAPLVFHVSCDDGDDGNPGEAGMPFRTLGRALRQVRLVNETGMIPEDGLVVDVAPGYYGLSEGIVIAGIASRGGRGVLTLEGHGGAVLSGGIPLPRVSFRPVTAPHVLRRLQPSGIGHVSCCDLKPFLGGNAAFSGVPDVFQGMFPFGELMLDGSRLPMARWPNRGWAVYEDVVSDGRQDGSGEAVLQLGDSIPCDRWREAPGGVWLQGFWRYDWYEETIRLASVDWPGRRIRLASSGSRYGVGGRSVVNSLPRRFRALNVLSELDCEGEWCLEPSTGMLYAWLPPMRDGEQLVFTVCRQPLMTLQGSSGVTVRGFVFRESRGDGLCVVGDGNEISDCVFRGLGGRGVVMTGSRNRLRRCDIHDCGEAGVVVKGGDVRLLTPGACIVEECHIHDIGRWKLTYQGGIHLSGVGNLVRHNMIHDVPHTGVFYGGNENCIEWNDIFGVCLETGDGGALYSGRDWSSFGNRVRHNYIHEPGGYGMAAKGVYLDDCDSGDVMEGNVFVAVPDAVFIGGGRSNVIKHNVFVGCVPAIFMDDRGKSRIHWRRGAHDSWDLAAKLASVRHAEPPWSEAYPELAGILEDSPEQPLHNRAHGNIAVNGVFLDMTYALQKMFDAKGNWLASSISEIPFDDWKNGDFTLGDMTAVRRVIPDFKAFDFRKAGPARLSAGERRRLYDACRSRLAEEPLNKEAGTGPPPGAGTSVNAGILGNVLTAGTQTERMVVDGTLGYGEWRDGDLCGKVLLETGKDGGRTLYPSLMMVLAGEAGLYVGAAVDAPGPGPIAATGGWGTADGIELTFGDKVLRGYPDGSYSAPQGVGFAAGMQGRHAWTCEWFIPWQAVGGRPGSTAQLPFNAVIHKSACGEMQFWRRPGIGRILIPPAKP